MPSLLRAQVRLLSDSSLPEDTVVNTWHFASAVTNPDSSYVGANLQPPLGQFYDAIDGLLSVGLSGTANVKWYDLIDPEPRVPIAEFNNVNLNLGSGALPSEVALCLSFQGVPVSGQPQARRRGRVYLGPLSDTGVVSAAGVGDVRPGATAINTVTGAADALLTLSKAAADWRWVIHSPTSGPGISVDVDNGWVDNAFDIQRRRGLRATQRTLFS